jgi:hypothetical protein
MEFRFFAAITFNIYLNNLSVTSSILQTPLGAEVQSMERKFSYLLIVEFHFLN